MKAISFAVLVLSTSLASATTCYTDCSARFPKWYQEPDRLRCAAEKARACLESSGLPSLVSLREFDGEYESYADRLLRNFTEGGYVISLDKNGKALHKGDSLLWTSLAMASLPCDQAAVLRTALTASILRNNGRILRFDPLPASYQGNETSRDAEVGALFGFATHFQRCPEARADLRKAWQEHYRFVEKHGKLHEGSNPNFVINPALEYVWNLVSHELLGTAKPSDESRHFFETGVISGAAYIANSKSACYPIHLSTLLLITTSRLGGAVNHLTRREYCHQTRGMNLPLTDWYCERGNPKEFLKAFEPNRWEYRHQRCASWESPDVDPGEQSPAVDFLAMRTIAGG